MPETIKKIAKKIIPFKYHFYFSPAKNVRNSRKYIEVFQIGDNAMLEVYWREDSLGIGPAASVYVLEKEVLRFDCFGEDEGHFHVTTPYKGNLANERIYYTEKTVEDQIERTYFELKKNISIYLNMNPFKKIRKTKIDHARLDKALEKMKELMFTFYKKYSDKMVRS